MKYQAGEIASITKRFSNGEEEYDKVLAKTKK